MISNDNIYSAYNKLHSQQERRGFLDGHPSFKIKVALLEKIDQIMKLEPKEEKISAEEIYQMRQERALPLIDALFLPFERDHCETAYLSELRGLHLPPEYTQQPVRGRGPCC